MGLEITADQATALGDYVRRVGESRAEMVHLMFGSIADGLRVTVKERRGEYISSATISDATKHDVVR